jgi:ADP-ribose pyrophosphatase YjhB (NUDIX family)
MPGAGSVAGPSLTCPKMSATLRYNGDKMAKKTHSAGGVVLNKKGQVLVVNQRGRSWSLPKGHIEEGEAVLEAARREIYEESGLKDLTFVKPLGSYERARIGPQGGEDGAELKHLTFFLFLAGAEELAPIDPDNPEARWVDPAQVCELLTHPKDREFFKSLSLGTRT